MKYKLLCHDCEKVWDWRTAPSLDGEKVCPHCRTDEFSEHTEDIKARKEDGGILSELENNSLRGWV